MSSITSSICSRKGEQWKNKSYTQTIKLTKSLTTKIQRSNRALQQRAGSLQSGPKQRRFLPLCYTPNPIPLSSQGARPRQSLRLRDRTHLSNQQLLDYYTSRSYQEKHRILRPVWVIECETLFPDFAQVPTLSHHQTQAYGSACPPLVSAKVWGKNPCTDSNAWGPSTLRGKEIKLRLAGERLPFFNSGVYLA